MQRRGRLADALQGDFLGAKGKGDMPKGGILQIAGDVKQHAAALGKGGEPCEVSAFSTETVLTKDFSEYLEGHLRDYYLEYSIKEGVTYPCSDTLLFVPEKHFRFRKPEIKTEIVGADRRFNITLSANCFVKDLELDFDGVDAIFSENYIDLTSPAPVKISVTLTGALETAYHLGRILKLRSVYDIK